MFDTPIVFYSRRIGLEREQGIPVVAGGRVAGRAGPYTVGVLDMQTEEVDKLGVPATNFAVVRVKRDILRRSAIGAIATRRSPMTGGAGSGETFGADGSFAFFTDLTITGYWVRTPTPGLTDRDTSYRVNANYNADRYGAMAEHMMTGDNFKPEIGYVRARRLPQEPPGAAVQPAAGAHQERAEVHLRVSRACITRGLTGVKETRDIQFNFQTEFQSSERILVGYLDKFELLTAPLRLAGGVTVPPGAYDLRTLTGQVTIGQQRAVSGDIAVEYRLA